MAVPTQTLSEEQMSSFERDVVAKGVKVGNWWAKQVAYRLGACPTPAAKRDAIAVCLNEVHRWRVSGSATQPDSTTAKTTTTATTIAAWTRLVEDWQRGHHRLR
jgi:hypothetical protein